jgi:glycosyltransferase involved in cell wall biosynthesis
MQYFNDGISVIICCYNSENRIVATLEHLTLQQVQGHWEVILVDNGCTDQTVAIAKRHWVEKKEPAPLRVVREEKAGLSHARKAGIQAATLELLCFCDDDNWLHPGYLDRALQIMTADPEIGVLGGRGIAYSDGFLPDWFNSRQDLYACGPQAEKSGELIERKWLWGAGMILRRKYLLALFDAGFQHINEDRKAGRLSSGGDTEICLWHLITGKKLWYDDDLVFTHWIARERLTEEIANQMEEEHDRSYHNLAPYFPLIYGTQYQNRNKLLLLLQALRMKARKENIAPLATQLRPLFDAVLDPATLRIIQQTRHFSKTNKA